MLPENLDHLRVGWISRGTHETAWATPGHDCLCSYKYGHRAAVRPQTNNAIWDGYWFVEQGRTLLITLAWFEGCANGCEPEPARWFAEAHCQFEFRKFCGVQGASSRAGEVPFSIRLDHVDVLVMDGPAQSEHEHCTASELQGPRVNLTYR